MCCSGKWKIIQQEQPKKCKEVKAIVDNYQHNKSGTAIIKFLSVYEPKYWLELYYILQDQPELFQALYFDNSLFAYFKKIFYCDYKFYEITQEKVCPKWFMNSMQTTTYIH